MRNSVWTMMLSLVCYLWLGVDTARSMARSMAGAPLRLMHRLRLPRGLRQCALAAGLALLAHTAAATEVIPLYTYYADLPFAVSGADNITAKLAGWLTQRAQGRYLFVATQLPRRRLDAMIHEPHWNGVVAWANPLWFGEDVHPRNSWSHAYMMDANLVVSLRSHPIVYDSDRSLEGLRLGSVLGFSYPDIEDLIKSVKLVRDEANSELQNLLRLKAGRVQVAFLQASSLPYFQQALPDFEQWAYIAQKPRTVFYRYLFTSQGQPELMTFLNQQLDVLRTDKDWQSLLGTCELSVQHAPGPRKIGHCWSKLP